MDKIPISDESAVEMHYQVHKLFVQSLERILSRLNSPIKQPKSENDESLLKEAPKREAE